MNQSLLYEFGQVMPQVFLTGVLDSSCNILTPPDPNTPGPLGQVDLSTLTPVTGLQGIECMKAVLNEGRVNPAYKLSEIELIREFQLTHVLLNGFFPTITKNMIAQITDPQGNTALFDIRNAEPDSQAQMTRLACREYQI